ncbi:cyclin-dependent kinase C-2-like isoform A [Micractinium conductrix]|uniref:Cyclin-dependent kinase C-2-like isoform A n=1 Tax=Micractinium conductrix TaxID=554055 RepID=A0A2P6V5E3_9CHLO|nr:cyclin-dependent kinase C-2-like isoform A [Micractinium conductrix]|eukprot:PSC69315.1 cyclin-dependent kinase C-2-like isoform A [Micractinium conductrix]
MSHLPPRQGGGKGSGPAKHTPIPTEWRIELPGEGVGYDTEFGGCRSIDVGYNRGPVLGQGTYGEVFLAHDKRTGEKVAAKKIKMDNEKEGFPITAIREIKILSKLAADDQRLQDGSLLRNSVIGLREIVRSSSHKANNYKGSIYMMFDYMDHDMTGLLERTQREGRRFTVPQVKCYLRQLFCGLALLSNHEVLHRDLKNANLLVNNMGELKIADFGLARYFVKGGGGASGGGGAGGDRPMTNRVITLWYRPPELFMGSVHYGTEIDMWSAGCIMYELLTGKPLFPGKDEGDQLDKILSVVGAPTEATMPGCTAYANYETSCTGNMSRNWPRASKLRSHCESRGIKDPMALDLLAQLLDLNPAARISAGAACVHQYFFSNPLPCKPSDMPKFESSHEMGMKRARHEQRYGGNARQQQGQQQQGGARGAPQGGAPAAQRQRTQGQYGGPQGAYPGQQQQGQQQPYRGGSAQGQAQPYRGGGAGGAPAAGMLGMPAGGMQPLVLPMAQVQQMMQQGGMMGVDRFSAASSCHQTLPRARASLASTPAVERATSMRGAVARWLAVLLVVASMALSCQGIPRPQPPPPLPRLHPKTPPATSGLLLRMYSRVTAWPPAFNTVPALTKFVPGVACIPSFATCAPELDAKGITTNFAAQFTGSLVIPKGAAGRYKLKLTSNDGSRLWIDGVLVIDHGGVHALTSKAAQRTLSVGRHRFRVEYWQKTGFAALWLQWQGTSMRSMQDVERSRTRKSRQAALAPAAAPLQTAAAATPSAQPTTTAALMPWQHAGGCRAATEEQQSRSLCALRLEKQAFGVALPSAAIPDATVRSVWAQWRARYGKVYRNAAAQEKAYKIFSKGVQRIGKQLSSSQTSWPKLHQRLAGDARAPVFRLPADAPILPPPGGTGPSQQEWDWRALGKVTPAKQQGEECKASFAFAAVVAIESQLLIGTGTKYTTNPVDLSEQQIINCARGPVEVTGFNSQGCAGGLLREPFVYASKGSAPFRQAPQKGCVSQAAASCSSLPRRRLRCARHC